MVRELKNIHVSNKNKKLIYKNKKKRENQGTFAAFRVITILLSTISFTKGNAQKNIFMQILFIHPHSKKKVIAVV